jgi:hypothetical protein
MYRQWRYPDDAAHYCPRGAALITQDIMPLLFRDIRVDANEAWATGEWVRLGGFLWSDPTQAYSDENPRCTVDARSEPGPTTYQEPAFVPGG